MNIRHQGVDCGSQRFFGVNFRPLGFDFSPLVVDFELLEVHFLLDCQFWASGSNFLTSVVGHEGVYLGF